jgi:threonine/homoserine/homoserine lactone efflux protein
MYILSQLIEIFLMGLIAGAIPGPVLTAVFTGVITGGFETGLKIILKALVSEIIIAVAIITLISMTDFNPLYSKILSLAGAIFLAYLALKLWKIQDIDTEKGTIFTFTKIFLLTVLSGPLWIFWFTVCVPLALILKQYIFAGEFLFIVIFELSWVLMTTLLAYIFSRFRPILYKKAECYISLF